MAHGMGSANLTQQTDPNYLLFAITLSEAASEAVTLQYRLWSGTGPVASGRADAALQPLAS